MQHSEQVETLLELMRHLDEGTNVDAGHQVHNPVSAYTCRDRAQQEWQTFFSGYPHVLGLSADLPGPNTFLTSTDLGKPILCTRDGDGVFRAFLNVCRHRGTIVESADRGQKARFHCPFHAWGYAASGELVAVPKEDHFGQVDRSCNSLVSLPAEERHGLLWVNPDPAGTLDLSSQLGDLDAELAGWNLEQYDYQGGVTYDHAMNWKLAIDTFGETYHFNALHRDTLAQDFHGNAQTYRTFERNHCMMLCLKNIDTLRAVPREQWHLLLGALPVYYLFPNVQLIIGLSGPTLVRVYPDGDNPHASRSLISFYLDSEFTSQASQRGIDPTDVTQRMRGFADVIRDEDYVAAASSHQGAMSGAVDHLVFGRNEPALHHYHNTYRDALGLPPLEKVSA